MKKILGSLFVKLYTIKSPLVRRCLRAIIARLDGGQAFSQNLRNVVRKYHGFNIGIGTYGPCFHPESTWVGYGNLEVGKYCSIASGVCLYSRNHPYWNLSTSPLFYNSNFFAGLSQDTVQYKKLTIGNDVWIGQYAVILPSCHYIGNGAVIGAGGIVTRDVPDYAVVAGNPGRIIKYRFSEDKIKILQQIRWWDWNIDSIKKNMKVFQDVDELIKFSEQRINAEVNQ